MLTLTRNVAVLASVILVSACASNQNPEPVPVEQTPEPVVTAPVEPEPVVEEAEVFTPPPAPNANIEFAFDSAELTPAEKADLQAWADYLNDLMINRVEIHGHADAVGTESYNRDLSAKRAYAASEALKSMVDHPIDISEVAHGETAPAADNDTEQGRQVNRRVEVVIPEDNNSVGLSTTPETENTES
ncbi:OmpA family protein [Hahella ganghwensis]|uniref:OmpA family protein n=1 Tax=Hahella ganghwensis TaxID=286420 RepID=UPI00037CF714|nr:OmpA family protein [Hahella ganghwensis]